LPSDTNAISSYCSREFGFVWLCLLQSIWHPSSPLPNNQRAIQLPTSHHRVTRSPNRVHHWSFKLQRTARLNCISRSWLCLQEPDTVASQSWMCASLSCPLLMALPCFSAMPLTS
jgi:hypothetical protein